MAWSDHDNEAGILNKYPTFIAPLYSCLVIKFSAFHDLFHFLVNSHPKKVVLRSNTLRSFNIFSTKSNRKNVDGEPCRRSEYWGGVCI